MTESTTTATGPLSGLRVIEFSLLGPAAVGLHLADLGAEVIKVESPQGDYVRQMTWPIIEGSSLLHRHINRLYFHAIKSDCVNPRDHIISPLNLR